MPRVTVPLGVAVVLIVVAPFPPSSSGHLTAGSPGTENYVFTATVRETRRRDAVGRVRRQTRPEGKAPFRRLPVSLAGDAEAQKTNQSAQLLDRLVAESR